MRLDLATDLRARIGAPDKDARLTNAFVEVKAGPLAAKNSAYPAKKETCVRKRPGCVTTGYDYTTPIQGAGGSLPYLIYDDTFSAFDAVPATSILIGDLVSGYYAMIDNPPTSPGPGDDYWSVTPPTSDRWRGTATIGLSDTPSATDPSNLIGAQAGSKAAAAKTFVEVTIAAISPGLKTLYDSSETWAVNQEYGRACIQCQMTLSASYARRKPRHHSQRFQRAQSAEYLQPICHYLLSPSRR